MGDGQSEIHNQRGPLSEKSRYSPHCAQITGLMDQGVSERLARHFVAQELTLLRSQRDTQRWKENATIDPLTKLHRRELYQPAMESALVQFRNNDRPMLIAALVDLDHVGHFNDIFRSHLLGDEALRVFATMAHGHLREEDQAFRRGGDEFALIFANTRDLSQQDRSGFLTRVEDFRADVEVHFMDNLVDELQNGQRLSKVARYNEQGKQMNERIGTIVLKEFAINLLDMKDNNQIAQRILQPNIKGPSEMKQRMVDYIANNIDAIHYRKYLNDQRVYSELSNDELQQRRQNEQIVCNDLKNIFGTRTCSIGMSILGDEDRSAIISIDPVDSAMDRALYSAKHAGRNRLHYSIGLSGDPIAFMQDSSASAR